MALLPVLLLAACAPALAQTGARAPRPLPPGPGGPGASAVANLPRAARQQETPAPPGTIQVTGRAEVEVAPDQALLSFAVETEASSAEQATTENARKMEAVLTALRATGVPGLRIETFGYSLRPEYRTPREAGEPRSISGYRAQNNVRVTVTDLTQVGEVLDRAIAAGANRVSGLEFRASDTGAARLQALKEAVASARAQAEAIAEAMGVQLGPALEVQGGANVPQPRALFQDVAVAATRFETTPVEAAGQKVSANVTIRYRIREPTL